MPNTQRSSRPGMTRHQQILEVLHRAYDLKQSDSSWLKSMAEPLLKALGSEPGRGCFFYFDAYPGDFKFRIWDLTSVNEIPENLEIYSKFYQQIGQSPKLVHRLISGPGFNDLGASGFPSTEASTGFNGYGLSAIEPESGTGFYCHYLSLLKQSLSPDTQQKLLHLCAHLASILRLRRKLDKTGPNEIINLFQGADAIFDKQKRLVHLEPQKNIETNLDKLRQAAQTIERAGSAYGRENPEKALDAWTALVSGQWSLVDTFDTDGKQFYVIHNNAAEIQRLVCLTPIEKNVAAQTAGGLSNKEIAYALGISPSAVAVHLHHVMQKTGLRSREKLVACVRQLVRKQNRHIVVVPPSGPGDQSLNVLAVPSKDVSSACGLTIAEQDVLKCLLAGKSNPEIASARQVSVNTVRNQIATLIKKLHVTSRFELIAKYSKPRTK